MRKTNQKPNTKNKNQSKQFAFARANKQTLQELKKHAHQKGMKMYYLLNEILENYLKQQSQKN